MTHKNISVQMESILRRQITLMDAIYVLQRKVYNFVLKKDWDNTKQGMTDLDTLSERFRLADQNLCALITESSVNPEDADANKTLDDVLSKLSIDERSKVTVLFKTLKEKVALSKIENNVFNTYLEHSRALLGGLFETVFDEPTGQTYTSTGAKADGEAAHALVNLVF